MSRRLVLLASLMLFGLSGCVTMNDGYYRQGYYSDGGYYYPAQDGYGYYYQGPQDVDYRYYDSYSYSPFWRLDRYACGSYYNCSPYWNSYYRRPYSGWSLSVGNHWNYGSWGWYGHQWSPWYDHHDYRRQPPRQEPGNRLPPGVLAPGDLRGSGPTRLDYTGGPRPGLRDPGVIDGDDGGRADAMPGPGAEEGFRPEAGRPGSPGPVYGEPGANGEVQERSVPPPEYRERYEGVDPQESPRYERPEPQESPRYERPEAEESPRYERNDAPEVQTRSQNESADEER